MRIVFMGTPDFSVPTLQTLINSEHEVIGVVTQPDKPKGRKGLLSAPPVKEEAIRNNIDVYQPKRVRDEAFINTLKDLNPDMIVVIAFGQILPKAILDIPKYGCINIHASLLPQYRGSAPINWVVINGEEKTGLTTMYMDEGCDTGDMLLKLEVPIEANETAGTLHDKLMVLGGDLIIETIQQLENGTAKRIKQDDEASSYIKMLTKEMGKIDWNKDALTIERLVRGLIPWPSVYTYYNGKMLKVWNSQVVPLSESQYDNGTIVEVVKNKGIVVKCGKDGLLITELQLQGKKRMDTDSFRRGVAINVGEQLGE